VLTASGVRGSASSRAVSSARSSRSVRLAARQRGASSRNPAADPPLYAANATGPASVHPRPSNAKVNDWETANSSHTASIVSDSSLNRLAA
jgi:hypothetical protein